ncbi:MAG: helix-turn-helix transcriptional regulator [[Clostridium] innocuum]
MEMSEKLYQLRKERGWSQEEVAVELQVSRQTVSKWESGATMPDTKRLKQLKRSLWYWCGESAERKRAAKCTAAL